MADKTGIEWTNATLNPWVGCCKVSPGCERCYAERDMTRKPRWANTWGPAKTTQRLRTSAANWKKLLQWNRAAEKAGRRLRVFCASLADVFEDHPTLPEIRSDLFDLMGETPWLDWQVLTKRPQNILKMVPYYWREAWPSHVWIGTSTENQFWADKRIPHLLQVPAMIRFVSAEPLLSPINLTPYLRTLSWIITGGESGPNARPMEAKWANAIRIQCADHGIRYFHKQNGGTKKIDGVWGGRELYGEVYHEWPEIPTF